MGEAIISRRGRAEASTTRHYFSGLTFRYNTELTSTGISVSDLINPELGKNVFVTITSFSFRSSQGSVTHDTTFSSAIIDKVVYIKLTPSYSSGLLDNVAGYVYKTV